MNITNNPNYTCITSKANPYLDTITFKPAASSSVLRMQVAFLFDRICFVTNAVPYIVSSGDGKPSAIYAQAMSEVMNNPKKYNCTKQELEKAYQTTFQILNTLGKSYMNDNSVNAYVLKFGVTVLNEKFFEDVSNGRLNIALFIDGMKKMGTDLYKYKSTYNIL